MRQNFSVEESKIMRDDITYLIGNADIIANMSLVTMRKPFDDLVIEFLNAISHKLMGMREAKKYPDVITFGFWLRKSSVIKLKERFEQQNGNVYMGRGVAFHIAPSNVAVNYAYSLVAGILTGNANIVRVPSKNFPQVEIINKAINESLQEYRDMSLYICLIKYNRSQVINDLLSSMADVRIVWGGDTTIAELRKSPLGPRATEITFADRYSLAFIDSDMYIDIENKRHVAQDFYNDTFLTDQNACTSPRMVVWYGTQIKEAKDLFWTELHELVRTKYEFRPIQGINKLTSACLTAVAQEGTNIETHQDNFIIRVSLPKIESNIMMYKDNSGYFFEYDCEDIMELKDICNNIHCQTIGYIGNVKTILPLVQSGIRGVDRVVPVGKTMDFDLIWDGYNLMERLTRTINII